jgi:cation diffusion facilitator family transporter
MLNPDNFRKIRNILLVILGLNWLVAAAKIVWGLTTNCVSISADGFHSLSDGASNIIGIIGIHLACRPTDSDHPYGHKKYETFFSLGIAFLLFLVAIGIAHESLGRFRNPVLPEIDVLSFAIMIITMAINLWVMRYEHKAGLKLKSDILVSDSLHTRADIFTSLSVIIALVVIKIGYPILDPIASIIISCFIAYSGFEIVREGQAVLCDTAVIMDTEEISKIVLGVKGVRSCHKIRTRGRPDDIYLDMHCQVHPDMHVDNAHKVSDAIEEAIKKEIPQVTDVVVHIEPKE